jgi:hypothetical protein
MGMALVLGAVLFGDNVAVQLFLVVAGLLMTEAGFWRLADPILPNERKYGALRAELEHFKALVRQLNTAALAPEAEDEGGNGLALEEVRERMHDSVDNMVRFAGKTAEEVGVEEAGKPDAGQDVDPPPPEG